MSYSSGIITAPVSISDVNNVLGAGSTVLSTLCKHANINCWSRYKPVPLANVVAPDRSSTWYKGKNGNCGVNYSGGIATTYKSIPALYDGDMNGWTKDTTALDYYRLMDFNHYNHNATPPIRSFSCSTKIAKGGTFSASCAYNVQASTLNAPSSLSLSDIDFKPDGSTAVSGADLYFGVVITDTSNNVRKRLTGTTKGTFDLSCNVSDLGLSQGTYRVFPFVSNIQIGLTDADKVGYFCTVPNVNYATLTMTNYADANGISIIATADKTSLGITLKLRYKISSGTLSWATNTAQFRFVGKEYTDSLVLGEGKVSIGTLNFTTTQQTYTTTFTLGFDSSKDYKVVLILNNGVYITECSVFDSIELS